MGLREEVPERELKFDARVEAPLPDLRPLVGRTVRHPQQQLNTAYFDSADKRLWGCGLTLRHRRTDANGDAEVWTLKTPVASQRVLERNEWNWTGERGAVPPDAERILRGVLRREPLHQVVELHTLRQRLLLHNEDDAAVAELDDDRVAVHGGPRDGFRFRQLELELRGDSDWSSGPVVDRLAATGLTLEATPKLAKAMGLPLEARVPRLDHKSSLADLLHALLVDGYRRLVEHDWRLRMSAPDVDAHDVHQARVATRRLRSNLKTFGDVLDPVWVRHVRTDLKWLGSALGDVRDVDVLMTQLPDLPPELCGSLDRQRTVASQRLETVLESERYLRVLDRLHAASSQAPMGGGEAADRARASARDALPLLIGKRWRAVHRQSRKARRTPVPERLHRVRIKAKQLRYAAEAATPVMGKSARRMAKAAERVQSDLGNHHDAVAAETWLRAQSERSGGAAAFEAGIASAAMADRRGHYERRWRRSRKSLAKLKRSRWLQ